MLLCLPWPLILYGTVTLQAVGPLYFTAARDIVALPPATRDAHARQPTRAACATLPAPPLQTPAGAFAPCTFRNRECMLTDTSSLLIS
jgi:hypothetical protein